MSQDISSTSSIVKSVSAAEGTVFSILSTGSPADIDVANEAESVIESNLAVQGGDYCLKGTRVTVQGILEAEKNGRSIDEIRRGLKKYFGVDRSIEELEQAKDEYQAQINPFINELCLEGK